MILGNFSTFGDRDTGSRIEIDPFSGKLFVGFIGAAPAGDGADPKNKNQRHAVEIVSQHIEGRNVLQMCIRDRNTMKPDKCWWARSAVRK